MKILTVYSTPTCTHCKEAKAYLDNQEIPYQEINLAEDAQALTLMRSRGHKSVPQIYCGDQPFVGGWFELRVMTREQIIEKMEHQ